MKNKKKFNLKEMNYAPVVSVKEYPIHKRYEDIGYSHNENGKRTYDKTTVGLQMMVQRYPELDNKWYTDNQANKLADKRNEENMEKEIGEEINLYKIEHDTKWVLYCPHCHKTMSIDLNKTYRSYEVKCVHCGEEIKSNAAKFGDFMPFKVTIYEMADGSKSMSLFYRIHSMYNIPKDSEEPCVNVESRVYFERIIFSRNGHSYYKRPQFLRDKKAGKGFEKGYFLVKGINPILDITYAVLKNWREERVVERVDPNLECTMQYLKEKNIIDVEKEIIKNRFRNLSEEYRENLLETMFDNGNWSALDGTKEYRKINITKLIRKINMYANDEEMLDIMNKKVKAETKGKKFKSLFYKNPFIVAFLWSVFHDTYGFKDINNFYKFYEANKEKRFMIEKGANRFLKSQKEFIIRYKNAVNENAVVNAMTSKDAPLLYDANNYISRIEANYMETFNQFKVSVNKMHEAAMRQYEQLQKMYGRNNSFKTIMVGNERLKQTTDKEQKRNIMERLMQLMEKEINNTITYHSDEMKLEDNINGYEFFLPKDTDSMLHYGEKLHNCVGRLYRMHAYHKENIIIIMKKDENYVGCIELKNGEIIQAYGPCNRTMTGETKEAYDMWLKKHTKLMKSGIKYGKEKVHMRVETMQAHYINMYNKYCKKYGVTNGTDGTAIVANQNHQEIA